MKLEEVLSPELYAQVKAAIDKHNETETDKTKHVRFVDLSEGGYVSAEKYNAKITALSDLNEDLKGQITKRDADMNDLNAKLTAAQTDAGKLTEAQTALSDLQTRYETERGEWESKAQKQAYEFKVREKANNLKFTSPAVKRDFISQAMAKEFASEGDSLVGYDEFVAQYTTDNPGAFTPDASAPQPQIVAPNGSYTSPTKKSLVDLMREKNEHPDAVISYD